jgi:hypothetical protein
MIKRVVECDMCSEEATLTETGGVHQMPVGWMCGRWQFEKDNTPSWHWVCTVECAASAAQEHANNELMAILDS